MKHDENNVRISGQVVAYEWDELSATRVMIIDDNEREYRVDQNGPGSRLADYEDSWVEVEGTVRRKDGERYITIKNFRVEDEFEGVLDDDDY
jgi:hypothetical protein